MDFKHSPASILPPIKGFPPRGKSLAGNRFWFSWGIFSVHNLQLLVPLHVAWIGNEGFGKNVPCQGCVGWEIAPGWSKSLNFIPN